MSYYPAPSKAECASEMMNHLKSITRRASTSQEILIKKKIDSYSDKELTEKCAAFLKPIPHERLGSLTGWLVAAKEEYCNRFVKQVFSLKARKKIIRHKIRAIGKFMVMYRNTLETLYAPKSNYERSIKLKYKHIFKTTSSSFPDEDAAEDYMPMPMPPPPPNAV